MCRISVVSSGGAVTSATSDVTCDSISVVVRSAVSTSLRTVERSTGSGSTTPGGCSSSSSAYSR